MPRKKKKPAKTEPPRPEPPSLPVAEAPAPTGADTTPRDQRRWYYAGAGIATVAIVAAVATYQWTTPSTVASPAARPAQYIGGNACAECHANTQAAWRGSDHDLAM